MDNHTRLKRMVAWILFILYILLLLHLMFFSEMEERGLGVKSDYTYNLKPFVEISRYIFHAAQIGVRGVMLNLVGNVVGFMPLGFILPCISKRCRAHWYDVVLSAYLLSFGIEMVQLVLRAGSCDVDDIILNTLGGLLGFFTWKLYRHFTKRR